MNYDAFNVALVVGGSIVIPHLRHAVESIDLARQQKLPIDDRITLYQIL
jgi:hypothetical protein